MFFSIKRKPDTGPYSPNHYGWLLEPVSGLCPAANPGLAACAFRCGFASIDDVLRSKVAPPGEDFSPAQHLHNFLMLTPSLAYVSLKGSPFKLRILVVHSEYQCVARDAWCPVSAFVGRHSS